MKIQKLEIKIPCCILALATFWLIAIPNPVFSQTAAPGQKLVADSSAGTPSLSSNANPGTPPALTNAEVLAELERMKARIQELESQLKAPSTPSTATESSSQPVVTASVTASSTSTQKNDEK